MTNGITTFNLATQKLPRGAFSESDWIQIWNSLKNIIHEIEAFPKEKQGNFMMLVKAYLEGRMNDK